MRIRVIVLSIISALAVPLLGSLLNFIGWFRFDTRVPDNDPVVVTLTLVGDGPDREQLQAQIADAIFSLDVRRAGELDALFVAGANPALTFPDGALARAALANVGFLVVADQVMTETASHADVVFAAASFAEKRGHVTNLEGRRQKFAQAIEAPPRVLSDAQIISSISAAMGAGDAVSDDPEILFAALQAAEKSSGAHSGAGLALSRIPI